MGSLKEVLTQSGLTNQEQQVSAVLEQEKTPWFLQPFIFLGAMVAALMFSGAFIKLMDIHRWNAAQQASAGAVYLLAAVVLNRRRLNIYSDALAMALSLGGHGFVLWAIDTATSFASNVWMVAFWVFLPLCAVLYSLYRDGLHRYLTVAFVLILAKAAFSKAHLDYVLHGLVLLTTFVAAWLLTRDRSLPTWRPLAQGCCTGLVVLLLPLGYRRHDVFDFTRHAMAHPWISAIFVGIALLWMLHWASQRGGRLNPALQILAVLVTAGLAALSTPGILGALFLTVLGHATFHAWVTFLGLSSLPIFLWKYYYNLEMSFLHKSGVLAASGAVLLIARWVLGYLRKET